MIKDILKISKVAKKSSLFLSGVVFGTAGLKLLASKEAKNIYSKTIAKSYKMKDCINNSVSNVKQQADDVLQDAKFIYESEKKDKQIETLKGE